MLNGDMYSCNSGVSYEDAVVAFLNEHGFQAHKTGKSDGGKVFVSFLFLLA